MRKFTVISSLVTVILFFSFYNICYSEDYGTSDTVSINLKIMEEEEVEPGNIVYLPVLLRNREAIGGFKLLFSWDPNVLTLHDVIRGECIDDIDFYIGPHNPHYLFERFYYEWMPCPETDKKIIKIVGLADMPDGYQGYPIEPNFSYNTLTYLKFGVKNDPFLKGFFLPVIFEWDDELLDDNTLCDSTGFICYVSTNPLQFPADTTIPDCDIVRNTFFIDGGIWVVYDESPWRGDVNVNEFPYEIADAVLFSNYFIYGINVFLDDPYWRNIQIQATDINLDGTPLTLPDLIFLIRITLELATPSDIVTPSDDTVFVDAVVNGDQITVSSISPDNIGGMLCVFSITDSISSLINHSNMDLKLNQTFGRLRVLLWSLDCDFIPSDTNQLFSFECNGEITLDSVAAADNMAREMHCVFSQSVDVPEQNLSSYSEKFQLFPNYPNPFNPTTNIEYYLPKDTWVNISIYNVLGQKVKTLIREYQKEGLKVVKWDGKGENGNQLSSGVYFYKLKTKDFVQSKKMLLLR